MNVVYDLSSFGSVELWPSSRAGIYRVVEDLARGLMESGHCSVNFSALEEGYYHLALKHLLSTSDYKDVYLPHFPHSQTHYRLTNHLSNLSARVAAASGLKKVGWRSARKTIHLSRELFNPDSGNEANLQNADVFHSPQFPIPQRVRRHKHIKTFLTVHDLIALLNPQFFTLPQDGSEHSQKVLVDGIRQEDWLICVSQSTKDDLCNYRKDLDPRRMFVTPLGASKWFYPCTNNQAIEVVRFRCKIPPGRYVLSVCTLEPRKNLAHLIRCFADLIRQQNLNDLYLVLVGNLGWKYESIFAELTSAKDLRDRIVIAGRVADEDMAALYSGSLFFVYPSLYEGFGLPPLEAMQCGVPVITSNTSSLPEVVGEAGVLVDPLDGDALSGAMLMLASDGDRRKELSQQSLQRAKCFSWEKCSNQTVDAYQAARGSV